ncbi:MAG: MFS transporter [Candidatus Pacebacteria bacterium]|nr:MFS transporter [Candidatus Paceibacterota bacterium]
MKTFYQIAANSLLVTLANFFLWFAAIFWVYLETQSVLASSLIAGAYMVIATLSGFWFGGIVDHHRKKLVMLLSSFGTLFFFALALAFYLFAPEGAITTVTSLWMWAFICSLLLGVVLSNMRSIALPITVTILVPEDRRDRANGISGMIMGFSSSGAGIASGFALAHLGMLPIVAISCVITVLALMHLSLLSIPEPEIVHTEDKPKKLDIRGTIAIISTIPGLFALIFFTTFNNFLGGVFMALMDPYGLTLVSVEVWGMLWGVLSLGFIVGGFYISRKGLGKNPLRTLLILNAVMWTATIIFPLQPSIYLLAAGLMVWTVLSPFIEATEHTIIQKVVPLERQGRVFGFAQSVEYAASPITAFLVGPLAQFVFIPLMTTGAGVALIGEWFGVGAGRGMALVFILASVIGLVITLLAMRSRSYKVLSERYATA